MNLPIEVLTQQPASQSTWRDWLGIVASVGCAIHCAAMPFVIAYLPALGLSFLADEAFHKWMFVVCMGIGLAAFFPGWKLHRRLAPIAIATVGLALIGAAAFGFAGECCAACEVDAVASDTESTETCACCEESCCAEEQDQATVDSNELAGTPVNEEVTAVAQASLINTSFLVPYAPWITPIGGLILIAAHLMNRRYGCRCGCCPSPQDVT